MKKTLTRTMMAALAMGIAAAPAIVTTITAAAASDGDDRHSYTYADVKDEIDWEFPGRP